jgi:hypothetical protein
MLFREKTAVYCEDHTKHTNTLCGLNAEYVKAAGTYTNHQALRSYTLPQVNTWLYEIYRIRNREELPI